MISSFSLLLSQDSLPCICLLSWVSTLFRHVCLNATTVRQSETQFRSKWPWTETTTPSASSNPSTSAPFSFAGEVTLEAIMAQLVHMDAHLDTLSDELCQVNTHVSRITWRQAVVGGFTASLSPSPQVSEEESDNDSSSGVDADKDDGASSQCWCWWGDDCFSVTYPLSFVIKMRSSFGYESSHVLRGRVSIRDYFC